MKAETLRRLRFRLEQQRENLNQRIQGDLDKLNHGNNHDFIETASYSETDALNTTLATYEAASLSQVEWAIKAIDEGMYGNCELCGNKIHPGRLQAMPFATKCLSCQEKSEVSKKSLPEDITSWGRLPEAESRVEELKLITLKM